jgi:hypothetical protein
MKRMYAGPIAFNGTKFYGGKLVLTFVEQFLGVADTDWIWIQWGPWMRIQIRIRNPDPDPGGQN